LIFIIIVSAHKHNRTTS